jgi:hypothetical protein
LFYFETVLTPSTGFASLGGMKPFEDMPPLRRELYHQIINGEKDFHPITLRLHFLNVHFPIDKLNLVLMWLVKNNIVGETFVNWFRVYCHNSDLEMHAKLLMVAENAPLAPVVAGKNIRL